MSLHRKRGVLHRRSRRMPRPLRSGLLTMVPVDGFLLNSSSFTGNPVSPKLLVSLTNTRIPHRLGSLVANSSRLQSRSFQRDVSSDVGSHQWSRGLLVNLFSCQPFHAISPETWCRSCSSRRHFIGNSVSLLTRRLQSHNNITMIEISAAIPHRPQSQDGAQFPINFTKITQKATVMAPNRICSKASQNY